MSFDDFPPSGTAILRGSELRDLLLERITLTDAAQAAMRRERSSSIIERPATLRWWRHLLYSGAR